jgi:hypothetical protein
MSSRRVATGNAPAEAFSLALLIVYVSDNIIYLKSLNNEN